MQGSTRLVVGCYGVRSKVLVTPNPSFLASTPGTRAQPKIVMACACLLLDGTDSNRYNDPKCDQHTIETFPCTVSLSQGGNASDERHQFANRKIESKPNMAFSTAYLRPYHLLLIVLAFFGF
jgi:hypothetical protein